MNLGCYQPPFLDSKLCQIKMKGLSSISHFKSYNVTRFVVPRIKVFKIYFHYILLDIEDIFALLKTVQV